MCSEGALPCKAALPGPRELLGFPVAAPSPSALRAQGALPGLDNMVMLYHACRSDAGGFPGLNSPRHPPANLPHATRSPCLNKEKKKKLQGMYLAFLLTGGASPAEKDPSG